MSTCPDRSIHSVYLDGELPQTYLSKYESHITSCPECQKILKSFENLKKSIQKESDSVNFTKEDLDSSFNRLQVKLSYHKITGQKKNLSKFQSLKYLATGIAAAAVVSFMLPLPQAKNSPVQSVAKEEKFQPITRNVLKSPANNTVYSDGTFNTVELTSVFGEKPAEDYANEATGTVPYVKLASSAAKNQTKFSRMHLSRYDMFITNPSMLNDVPTYEQYSGKSFNYYTPTTVTYNTFSSEFAK